MSEELSIDVAWLEQGGYYEIHLLDEDDDALKFVTADTDDEVLERVRELLPRLRPAAPEQEKESE